MTDKESALRKIEAIAFSSDVRSTANAGKRPFLAEIPLAQLRVETRYQRDILARGRKNIRKIVSDFRWSRFSPLIVASIGNDRRAAPIFAVIDGQHRATALACLGITTAPCIVHELDAAGRADAYAAINTAVTAMTPQAKFFAQAGAGDETATAVVKACAATGVTPMRYSMGAGKLKDRQCVAVGALYNACRLYGPDVLEAALRLICERDGYEPGDLVSKHINAAAGALASDNRLFVRIDEAIIAAGQFDFVAEADRALAAPRLGGESSRALLQTVLVAFLCKALSLKSRAA